MSNIDYSALPMVAYAGADPDLDMENPRFTINVDWTWPLGDWTHFSIVRCARAPARRREEGQVMMEILGKDWPDRNTATGAPTYRDPQPPPGEWVFYTAFVLNPDRVWVSAGSAFEIGIADYDWAIRLPELLPGVAVGDVQRSISPADQSRSIVQFLQSPGGMLDQVVTIAEASQNFWDPLTVPPQMLEPLTSSIGYDYDLVLGAGRLRYIIDALMGPQQGSTQFINQFTDGATGCITDVIMSNNLMLEVNQSSFENGTIPSLWWTPIADWELRKFENWLQPTPVLHPNVQHQWFAYIRAGGTFKCGAEDPLNKGIPCVSWAKARMACYAFSSVACTLSMGLDLYDYKGAFIRTVEILPSQTLTGAWTWYGNAGDEAVDLGAPGFAYAVPYFTISNPCSIDLIVVDDG